MQAPGARGAVLLAVAGPRWLPHTYDRQDLFQLYAGPSGSHLLGTDHLGRDLLARLVYGARISLTVGLVAELIIIVIGTLVGAVAGSFGGGRRRARARAAPRRAAMTKRQPRTVNGAAAWTAAGPEM